MFKLLIAVVVLMVIGTLLAAMNFLSPKQSTSKPQSNLSDKESTRSGLQKSTDVEVEPVSAEDGATLTSSSNLADHVALLEKTVQVLQKRIETLEKVNKITYSSSPAPEATVAPIAKKFPTYIYLGTTDSKSSQTYQTSDNLNITLDAADFVGATSIQFEAMLKLPSVVGTAYAKIYNSSDGADLSGSEISTPSRDYVYLISGGFNLSSGKKNYVVQLKSSSGNEVFILNPRLKINY